jgi:CRP/FNR family transcriptional regulator, cyclic AMP receptor protein
VYRARVAISDRDKSVALGSVPLFAGLSEESMERLTAVAGELEFRAGQLIVRQGQAGTGLYVILEGEASVLRGSTELARLRAGDFFGELAVFDQRPRMASARAEAPTRCLAIASWDLLRLLEQDPALSLNMIRGLVERVRASGDSHRH